MSTKHSLGYIFVTETFMKTKYKFWYKAFFTYPFQYKQGGKILSSYTS